MTHERSIAVLAAAVAAAIATACARPSIPTPDIPGQVLVVLLPDPDSNTTGRAFVANPEGAVDLIAPRDSTRVAPARPPAPVHAMSEEDVNQIFGEVLAALPPPPQSFTLFFRFDSEQLTDESRKVALDVMQAVRNRPFPDVVVLGHTDTTGSIERNFELGLKRANTVRALLVEIGLHPAAIEVTSHGEAELLVPTADEVFEPRNRRVDITVR